MSSYRESTARQRLALLLDGGSFTEFLPPSARMVSPHLAQLDLPVAMDDGVAVGAGTLQGAQVFAAAQEGGFMGGAVGEVHGAKLAGLLLRAAAERPAAVLLLLESGGVRLHEANAGLIAVSEVMRALLAARAAGVPVVALIGGANGAFGGTGIIARCANAVVMSEEGRLAMSGPEVIETVNGVEEYDSRDRALVWRTCGGKHRYLLGDCHHLTSGDDVADFRRAALEALDALKAADVSLTLEGLEGEHDLLARRLQRFGGMAEPMEIWRAIGVPQPDAVPLMDPPTFVELTAGLRLGV